MQARVKAGVIPNSKTSDSDKSEEVNGDVTIDDSDVEMAALISSDELEDTDGSSSDEDDDAKNETYRTSWPAVIKLLLLRTPWYIIGLVVLVVGLVLSQYRIHLPYEAECDDNFTNSSIPDSSINITDLYI